MDFRNIFIFITFYQLSTLILVFPATTTTNVDKRNVHDFPSTDVNSRNLRYGNNLFSKKSLDFDPEDEIMYNSDDVEKSMEEMPLNNEFPNTKKTLYDDNNIGAEKKDIVNKIPGTQSSTTKMCDLNGSSNECLCERSCLPNLVHNFSPCQCIEILTDQESPVGNLRKVNNDKVDSYSSGNVGQTDVKLNNNLSPYGAVSSACERACVPHRPLSQSPCLCDIGENYKNMNYQAMNYPMKYSQIPTLSTPFSSETPYASSYQYTGNYPFYPQQPQTPLNLNTMSYNYPAAASSSYSQQSNFYPSSFNQQQNYNPSANTVNHQPTSDTKVRCKKACFPFLVKASSPCTCDFNSYKSPYSQQNAVAKFQDNSAYSRSSTASDFDPAYNTLSFQSGVNQPTHKKPWSHSQNTYDNYTPGVPRNEQHYQDGSSKKISYTVPRYIGCYKDEKEHGRDLKIDVPIEKLTINKCVKKCRNKKKRFAGVQYGYLCFCGSRFGRYGKAHDQNCTTQCVGDRTQMCGGPWFNSIYSTDGQRYSETQFSFSTPDSMDEIKAEEEKRKHTIKAKTRHIKPKKLHSTAKKKTKLHKKNNQQNSQKPSIKQNVEVTTQPPELENTIQDVFTKEDGEQSNEQRKTNNTNLENLKQKLKTLWNKTFEKSSPPTFQLSKLNDDDSVFYKTANNDPSELSLNKTELVKDPHINQTNITKNNANGGIDNKTENDEEQAMEQQDNNDGENEEQNGETSDDIATTPSSVTSSSRNENNTADSEEEEQEELEDDENQQNNQSAKADKLNVNGDYNDEDFKV